MREDYHYFAKYHFIFFNFVQSIKFKNYNFTYAKEKKKDCNKNRIQCFS